MGQDVAIEFRNVSKRYRIGAGQGSLRSAISDLFSRRANKDVSQDDANTLWALRDVSFELKRGETLGIIGHNGAGKTTILKLLSRITRPTEGEIRLHGRVSSLIELGAGFHPELTGRENVFLNGQILGMSRREIAQRYDEIVAFAELGDFMDTPVKRYSSGMYARLGFSVAAHLDPDILLVDEVLAVGDVNFQQKCLERMTELTKCGSSVIFVSHHMDAVRSLCVRCIWLDRGCLKMIGDTSRVVQAYLDDVEGYQIAYIAQGERAKPITADLVLETVIIKDADGNQCNQFKPGDDIVIELHLRAERPISTPYISIGVGDVRRDSIFLASMLIDGETPNVLHGRNIIRCHFRKTPLMPGNYQVRASVRGPQGFGDIIRWGFVGAFSVSNEHNDFIRIGQKPSIVHLRYDAPVYVPYSWEIVPKDDCYKH